MQSRNFQTFPNYAARQNILVTGTTNKQTFTAPLGGFIYFSWYWNNTNGTAVNMNINNSDNIFFQGTANNYARQSGWFPLRKGETFSYKTNKGLGSDSELYFIPCL